MTLKKRLLYLIIQVNRYIFKRKFITVFDGPLKGYRWSTDYNYDYIIGDYEIEETMKTFCSWLHPTAVLYDMGANVGYYAFIANQYISKGVIYSFEPMPANIRVFEAHLQLNKDKLKAHNNITLLQLAVSDKEGEVGFSNNDASTEGNTYVASGIQKNQNELKIKCVYLDGLLDSGYKVPDVLKIDVEGAEYDVLRGAKNTLLKHKPNILLATHDCHLPGVQKKCVDFLQDLGYQMFLLPNDYKIIEGLDDYIAIHKEKIN